MGDAAPWGHQLRPKACHCVGLGAQRGSERVQVLHAVHKQLADVEGWEWVKGASSDLTKCALPHVGE